MTNTTGLTLTDTVITSTVPLSSSVVPGSVTGGGVASQRTVTWTEPDTLPPGEVITTGFTIAVDPIDISEDDGFMISNSASVRSGLTRVAYSTETLLMVLGALPPPSYRVYLPITLRAYSAGW